MKKNESHVTELMERMQGQGLLRDELLRRQETLLCEVSAADVKVLRRNARLLSCLLALVLMPVPTMLVTACTTVPDGCSMRAEIQRTVVLDEADQIISLL